LAVLLISATAVAEIPRVLPQRELPKDVRLEDPRTLNSYFPFHPCDTPEAWAKRGEEVRRRVLVATGLWPMPTKTPSNPVIHGKVDREEYTVEKVYFASFPGHFVTGNLYRPKGRSGKLPAVLCPHGHWANGRFYDAGEKSVGEQIEQGGEKFAIGGRHPIQARCVQLARMGCVVFHYDMVGYADSRQIAHRPGVRQAMNTPKDWGYFSPQAEARMQNMMGLQSYNSVRALDFLAGLPDVDPKRIGVTGASGGGTQTFVLSAIDPRPAVSFPAVMVSTAMQGGCTCENACYLRVGTGNVEIAALFSPRPLGLSAANDWTKEMTTKGFPELKQHYKMLGIEDRVMIESLVQFGHNYNYPSRAAMYGWFNRHLKIGQEEPIVEEDYRPLSVEEMSVWDEDHPKPPGGDDHERSLLKWITEDSNRQMAALVPRDRKGLDKYRRVVGGALEVMIGRGMPDPEVVKAVPVGGEQLDACRLQTGVIRYETAGEEVPGVVLSPAESGKWNREVVIWLGPAGKQVLFDAAGNPKPAVMRLVEAGMMVTGVDLFGQGEFTADGKPMTKNKMVKKDDYAGYTYGYNPPLFARRVHDVLSTIAVARAGRSRADKVYLVGLDGAGHWAAAARALAVDAVDAAAIDTSGFRFAKLTSLDHADFLPGGAKYGDLPGVLALSAPGKMLLAGEGARVPPVVTAAYAAAGHSGGLDVFDGEQEEQEAAVVEWILGQL